MKQRTAAIAAIEYHLPESVLGNEQLAREFQGWPADKILAKTGIQERHIAGETECSTDLAVEAAKKLFESGVCRPEQIDYILLCTMTPDHVMPASACLIQTRLGIPQSAGALDFDLACSGFVAGLGLAKGLIETSQADRVLLLTAETMTKFIHQRDKSVRTIFGDGATATLVTATENEGPPLLGPFVYGTDGSGAKDLIVPAGGMRNPRTASTAVEYEDHDGNVRCRDNVFMDGASVFAFTLRSVPACVKDLLARADLEMEAVDLFVFHQANLYMLDHLRKKLKIPEEKFVVAMGHCGNTFASTIPIALKCALQERRIRPGSVIALVGFGAGYSWAAALMRWAG